jgi:ATP-dependent RNA circularization protein (DNA/RNA ligase family)
MKALVVTSKSATEMKFVADLLKKLGVSTRLMDVEEMEDQAMSLLMKEVDRSKKVSKSLVMKKLGVK